jgi:hypothetical protein
MTYGKAPISLSAGGGFFLWNVVTPMFKKINPVSLFLLNCGFTSK